MSKTYVQDCYKDCDIEIEDDLMGGIFKQYEKVVIDSLITSFGLNFIMNDKYGGDVDTIHNVRQIGKDEKIAYKNKANQISYTNRGEYNSSAYHSHKNYIETNRELKIQKNNGTAIDAYTGMKIGIRDKSDLDHTIAAKEIHDDAGRVLSGRSGVELANMKENLNATNPSINRSKKMDTMDIHIKKKGDNYDEKTISNMKKADKIARKTYEKEISRYYTEPKFLKEASKAALSSGVKMGSQQVLGFIFTEVWLEARSEFNKIKGDFDLATFLKSMGNAIKRGFTNAKSKYKEVLSRLKDGVVAGILSNLTTTICNIFFTTAKNTARIIRQSWASLVQALKILFINPDGLPFGERIRAVVKILATTASIIVGTLVSTAIQESGIGKIPVIGNSIQLFFGSLVTGLMTCTLLHFLDKNETVNKLVRTITLLHADGIDIATEYFRNEAKKFEIYAAKLMEIDLAKFRKETEVYNNFVVKMENIKDDKELNNVLKEAYKQLDIKLPWQGSFDEFMSCKSNTLVFE